MKKLILLVALITLVAFVSGAMAQQKPVPAPAPAPAAPEKPKLEKFSGVIEKVDEAVKAIEVKQEVKKEGKTLTFAIDDKTKITKGKETLSFAGLKKGMHVSIEYKKDGDKNVAVAVEAEEKPAKPEKK